MDIVTSPEQAPVPQEVIVTFIAMHDLGLPSSLGKGCALS